MSEPYIETTSNAKKEWVLKAIKGASKNVKIDNTEILRVELPKDSMKLRLKQSNMIYEIEIALNPSNQTNVSKGMDRALGTFMREVVRDEYQFVKIISR